MAKLAPEFAKYIQDFENPRVGLWMATRPISTPTGINLTIVKIKEERQGRCYELAGRFVLDNEDWTLVHGITNPPVGPYQDTPYAHAWVEKGNIVYDPVFNTFYNKDEYYNLYEPSKMKRYNIVKLRANALKYKHWGFW